jgi:hypothetical protein
MPMMQFTPGQIDDLVKLLEPDLSYLFDEMDVPLLVQANVAHRKIVKLGVFAKAESTEEAFREWLKVDFGLDQATDVDARVTVAKLAEAWEASRQRAVTVRKIEAEARASGQAKEMLKGVHLSLRRACARTQGVVDDRRCPGRAYVEARLEQVDDGAFEAESLAKVTTVAIEQEQLAVGEHAGVDVRRDGLLRVVKGKHTAPLPTSPEQYRAVLKVMGLHWQMVQLKGAARAVLADFTTTVFEDHVDYILGDECYLIAEANSSMPYGPSWELLMKYEHEIRKLAIRKVNEEGATLSVAMALARVSVEHRTKFFIAPLAMPQSRARSTSDPPPRATRAPSPAEHRGAKRDALVAFDSSSRERAKGGGKGGAKGKKGKDPSASPMDRLKGVTGAKKIYQLLRNSPHLYGCRMTTKDNKGKCHKYQTRSCDDKNCSYIHICAKCDGMHPATECPELGLA